MDLRTTKQRLRAAFAVHGKVSSASIVTDRTKGQSAGFGFVEMPNARKARAAMAAMNKSELDGRILTVNETREMRDGPWGARRKRRTLVGSPTEGGPDSAKGAGGMRLAGTPRHMARWQDGSRSSARNLGPPKLGAHLDG